MSQTVIEPMDSERHLWPPANATPTQVSDEGDSVINALVPRRDVYDPDLLKALARRLPKKVAEENQAVLMELHTDGGYVVGMVNTHLFHVKNVARALNLPTNKLDPRAVSKERLQQLQDIAYDYNSTAVARSDEDYEDLEDHNATRESIDWSKFDTATNTPAAEQAILDNEPVIGTGTGLRASAERIILAALSRRASDMHVIPGPETGRINYRTDGLVYPLIQNIPASRMDNLANAFSDMAGINGYELMQKGLGAEINIVVKTASGKRERMTLRFHGRPSLYGRAIVIRFNRPVFRDFSQIGLEQSQIDQIQKSLDYRTGVVLVTGATGSGKSNTLEAMLRKLELMHEYRKHVIQLGNPIEFPNTLRTQLPVNGDDAWSEALKDAMRMDPDIFSPGEFRDAEEAAIVFQGASTGHLTLTTLHTNNIAQTFSRLDFLKIGRDKQGDLIRLIVSQELVPVLCAHCKKPDPRGREIAERLVEVVFPNRPELRDAITRAQGMSPFFHAEGCAICHNTGIKGRTCVAEVLRITPDIGRMLRQGVYGEEIVDYAVRAYGMMTLAEAAARKLCRGLISYDHVRHLLISTNQAAPEHEAHAWESTYDTDSAGEFSSSMSEDQTAATDAPSNNEPEDYLDAEVSYPDETAVQAAA